MRRLAIGLGLLVLMAVAAIAASSAGGEFSVTPDSQLVNWTSGYSANITISNLSATQNVSFYVYNLTSPVINGQGTGAPFVVLPSNSSWLNGSSTYVTLVFSTAGLAAGRYTGNVNISNATNATESAAAGITLDVPLNVNSAGQGSVSGNVTASTYDMHYVNMTAVSAYGLRVNLTGATALPINLIIKDGSGTVLRTASFNASNSTQLDYTSARTGYWLLNWTGNATFSASVELLEPSLLGNGALGAMTVTNKTNRGYNTTLTTYFWLNNSADYDVNISSITNSSLLNLTGDPSKSMQISTYNISAPWNLSANNGTLVAVNITINTLNNSNSEGNYVGWLTFGSDRGYPNSTLNVSLAVNMTGALDVSGVTFANESGGSFIIPSSRLNITVLPKWQNGTAITNLMASNFGAWIYHQNYSSLTSSARNLSFTINGATWNNSHYIINASIPSTAIGGNYTLYVQAAENNSLNSGTVATAANVLTVNDSALKLSIENDAGTDISGSTSVSLSGGDTWKVRGHVTNYGTKAASAVGVSRSLSGSCVAFTSGAGSPVGIGDMTPGGTNTTANVAADYWTFTAPNASNSCTLNITAAASGTAWDRSYITISFSVSVSGGSGSSGGNSGGQTGSSSNTTNTTGSSTEMTILDWPKETYVMQGSSQNVNVRVKNSGTTQLDDVTVAVESIASSWWSSTDKRALPKGTYSDWAVAFIVPASAGVSNYSMTFVANNAKTTARATGLLVVTPGPAMQEEIKRNITNMTTALDDFQKELDKMKAAGKDVAQANSTLAAAFELLKQANGSAASSSWLAAFNQLAGARAKFAEAQAKLSGGSKATASAVLPGAFDLSTAGLLVGVFLSGVGLAGTAVWIAIEKGILKLSKGVLPKVRAPAQSQPVRAQAPAAQKDGFVKRLLERLQRRKKTTAYHWRPGA